MNTQDPKTRTGNFEEVALGLTGSEAIKEAKRCLGCKKAACVGGCPVEIDIPGFLKCLAAGDIEAAIKKIKEKNYNQ